METLNPPFAAFAAVFGVRMELFPERDGNRQIVSWIRNDNPAVRMELFPERDGNCVIYAVQLLDHLIRPNGALP